MTSIVLKDNTDETRLVTKNTITTHFRSDAVADPTQPGAKTYYYFVIYPSVVNLCHIWAVTNDATPTLQQVISLSTILQQEAGGDDLQNIKVVSEHYERYRLVATSIDIKPTSAGGLQAGILEEVDIPLHSAGKHFDFTNDYAQTPTVPYAIDKDNSFGYNTAWVKDLHLSHMESLSRLVDFKLMNVNSEFEFGRWIKEKWRDATYKGIREIPWDIHRQTSRNNDSKDYDKKSYSELIFDETKFVKLLRFHPDTNNQQNLMIKFDVYVEGLPKLKSNLNNFKI